MTVAEEVDPRVRPPRREPLRARPPRREPLRGRPVDQVQRTVVTEQEAPRSERTTARWRSVVSWVVTVAVLAVWFVALRPVALGGPASFVGVTGFSMEPTFYEGDLVVVHAQEHYSLGDVIAYRVPQGEPGAGHNIVHRIVGGDGVHGYTTQGDNNSYIDVWHPVDGDVIGEVWVEAPNLAGWMGTVRSPGVLALIVGVGAFVAIVVPDRRKAAGARSPDPGGPLLDGA